MILGTQYYRPPFPERRYWRQDMAAIAEAGLDTVQLWACWGWIEPAPGEYRFEDFDELMSLAESAGLRVVLSTVAEIQPFWIHRELPDAAMVDHMGRTVVSSVRGECNVGLTPGGCSDNGQLADRMATFLRTIGARYAGSDALIAWDCWNETRWAVQADGYVCYCPSTLAAFREWLRARYGSLEGLSEAWRRRYASWEDVVPGKAPGRPYTDIVEFEAFLTWRAAQHVRMRADALRSADARHPVLAHGMGPAAWANGEKYEQAVSRGNDFDLAEELDGIGCSHFPLVAGIGAAELGARLEATRSAAGSKPHWVSELQGGAAASGFTAKPAVDAGLQQRWVWSAYGRGVEAVLFWCWRDEVFGGESSGFGLAGSDGQAAARLERLRQTGAVLKAEAGLLDGYMPDEPQVGVLFSSGSHQLEWAQDGERACQARGSVVGWLTALERAQLPYAVLDAARPAALAGLKLVVLPWPLVVPPAMSAALAEWVRSGGTLVTEAGLGSFDERGFFRYSEDRWLAEQLGVRDLGRRVLQDGQQITATTGHDDGKFSLPGAGWLETYDADDAEVLHRHDGEATAVRRTVGRGCVIAIGSFPGLAYGRHRDPSLEGFARSLARSTGAATAIEVTPDDGELVQWRSGTSGRARLLFVVAEPAVREVRLSVPVAAADVRLLVGERVSAVGEQTGREFELELSRDGVGVMSWSLDRPEHNPPG